MLQPHELFPGAILEYNIGTVDKPDWVTTTIDSYDIGHCESNNADFNLMHRHIPLTEKILVEWCGFEKMFSSVIHTLCELTIDKNTSFYFYNWHKEDRQYLSYKGLQIEVLTLHHLQLLVFALTQQPLKITLP